MHIPIDHHTRRKFIRKLTLGVFSLPFVNKKLVHEFIGTEKINPHLSHKKSNQWGIILNTLKEDMQKDYRGTLEQLAEMGYKFIEGKSYGDSPKAYKKFVHSLGLEIVVGGNSIGNLEDNIDEFVKLANELEYQYVSCYWPWRNNAKNLTKKECMEAAESLNFVGKRLKEEGFGFTWHNHDKEFVEIEGKTAYDWLVQYTDPAWVNMQMDIYWVRKGNHDPLELIEKYPGRFKLLHIKDMDHSSEREMTCPGEGKIDFNEIFEKWEEAGVVYATVENERNKAGIHCAQASIDYLFTL